MAKSLHGFIPGLARQLGLTPAALYERQKALMRAGELRLIEGHGPGSGVRADARGVALLIIATMATDSLSDTERRVREIANAEPVLIDRESWVSPARRDVAETLLDELEKILSEPRKALDIVEFTVSRTSISATITFEELTKESKMPRQFHQSPLATEGEIEDAARWKPPIQINASISGTIIFSIATDLEAMTKFSDHD